MAQPPLAELTVTLKSTTLGVLGTWTPRGSDATVRELREAASAALSAARASSVAGPATTGSSVRLVLAGSVLKFGDADPLDVVFGSVRAPVVFVVPAASTSTTATTAAPPTGPQPSAPPHAANAPYERISSDAANEDASEPNSPNSPNSPNEPRPSPPEPESPSCRICFAADSPSGSTRLIRPCRCRGGLKHVHVECLNEWRTHAHNQHAHEACGTCGYRYNVQKNELVQLLLSDAFLAAATGAALLAGVLLAGFAAWAPRVADAFYDVVDWNPRDAAPALAGRSDAWVVDHLVLGTAACGIAGFAMHVSPILSELRERFDVNVASGVVLMLTANGRRGVRIFCVCGLATTYYFLADSVRRWSRRAAVRFGERVLDLDESVADALGER